jgi:hypothetical protein
VAAAAQFALGCYREVPVAWNAAPAQKAVEVTLDPAQAAPLAAAIGPRARRLEGRVVARTDSTLTLAVTSVARTSGSEETWPGSEVVLPQAAIERVTVRRVSALGSALIVGLIAGGGTLIGAAVGGGSSQPGGRIGGTTGRQ